MAWSRSQLSTGRFSRLRGERAQARPRRMAKLLMEFERLDRRLQRSNVCTCEAHAPSAHASPSSRIQIRRGLGAFATACRSRKVDGNLQISAAGSQPVCTMADPDASFEADKTATGRRRKAAKGSIDSSGLDVGFPGVARLQSGTSTANLGAQSL